MPKGGASVEWDKVFTWKDLSAPGKGPAKDHGKGKKEVYSKVSNSAPTVLNLPHNSFCHPEAMHDKKRAQSRAAKDGDVGAIQKVLDAGAHVNTLLDSYDLTALHYAAWHGRAAAAFELIQRGAAIDARNRDQKTPLHLCASNGKANIIRELVRQGASLTVKDRDGQTPLDVAEMWGNVQTSSALRQAAHEVGMGRRWRPQSGNKLEQPKRIASYKNDGANDDWKIKGGFGGFPKHHVSVQRAGVWPCTEAWRQ